MTPAGTYSIATAYSESSWSGGYSKYNGTEWINSGGGGLTVVTQITCSQSLKVGIGKNNPAYALDVNGTINAKTILVNGSPIAGGGSQWADVNGGISYSGGFATIDLITLSGGPGRDALILKSSTDNDASSLVTNRQKFLFWSQHLNDWADIQARNALFTSGLEVSGDILLTNGANRVIKIKNQSAEDTSGNSLTISAGDANDTIGGLSGGNLYLTGGDDPMGTKGNVFLASNGGKVCLGNTTSCISNWSEVGSGFTLTGGTANYVPLWKDANTLDISNIIQDAKGNIGIGTTAPAGTLDVNGSIYQSVGTIADSIHSSNRQKTKSIGQLTLGNDASQEEAFVGMKTQVFKGQGLEKENQADIAFYTWGNSYANSREVMRIRSSGNVGIGTTAPKQKLSIYSGNIKITNGNMYFETIAPPNPTGVPNVSCLNATSESKYLYIIYSYVTDIGGETVTAWSGQCSNYDGIGATMAVPPVGAGNIISKRIYLAKSNSEISDLKSSTFQNHLPKFHYIMDVNPNLISQNIYFSARDTGKTLV